MRCENSLFAIFGTVACVPLPQTISLYKLHGFEPTLFGCLCKYCVFCKCPLHAFCNIFRVTVNLFHVVSFACAESWRQSVFKEFSLGDINTLPGDANDDEEC